MCMCANDARVPPVVQAARARVCGAERRWASVPERRRGTPGAAEAANPAARTTRVPPPIAGRPAQTGPAAARRRERPLDLASRRFLRPAGLKATRDFLSDVCRKCTAFEEATTSETAAGPAPASQHCLCDARRLSASALPPQRTRRPRNSSGMCCRRSACRPGPSRRWGSRPRLPWAPRTARCWRRPQQPPEISSGESARPQAPRPY